MMRQIFTSVESSASVKRNTGTSSVFFFAAYGETPGQISRLSFHHRPSAPPHVSLLADFSPQRLLVIIMDASLIPVWSGHLHFPFFCGGGGRSGGGSNRQLSWLVMGIMSLDLLVRWCSDSCKLSRFGRWRFDILLASLISFFCQEVVFSPLQENTRSWALHMHHCTSDKVTANN